jgi:hypothetical protein
MVDRASSSRVWAILLLVGVACDAVSAGAADKPVFKAGEKGEYRFDTGLLRGVLCAGGKSSGLKSVVHVPTGARLDRGAGICGYYRIFTTNRRYGKAAWDWPGRSRLLPDGAVEITLPQAEGRPFELVAVYRWGGPATLDLETTVRAGADLGKFEVFLASYFHESLPSPYVYAQAAPGESGREGFLLAEKSHGDWLMFPREKALVPIIRDGRWEKEPHPVNWTIMPELELPLAFRRGNDTIPTAVLMAPRRDCFAIAMPYEGESHYSLYLSLFGRDVKGGESATARTRFVVTSTHSDRKILELHQNCMRQLGLER